MIHDDLPLNPKGFFVMIPVRNQTHILTPELNPEENRP